ncbi:Integrase catalytic domain-containing protein [Citrus sinensis]|nr:Integrase catalytic domain-containing protein [Citrus sinensis]
MGVLRVEKEVPSAVAPSRLFKALNDSHNLLPKIAPQTIKSIDILQGDGGVGTVKLLKFAGGGDYQQTKQRIDALDEANLTGKYTTYEGDGLLKLAEKSVYDIKIVDSGNGGSIFKFVEEIHVNDDKLCEMKDLGAANKILGMQIYRDRINRKIWLSQTNYLKKILRRFNMQDCKSISTPLPVNFKLSSSMCPSNEAERKKMSRVPYASAVGSLMFAMICTRPDIAQAVGAVSRYMANPGGEHWIAVKRILRYIRGTSDVALCYGGSEFTVKGYVDSDFAGDLDKRKSTTGYVFTFAGAAVSWVSKLQTVVALSTTEAEYMAATQACKEAIWIQRLLEELGHKQQKIPVFCDSQSALHIARNPAFHSRTKHIGVQYHFVREVVEDGSVDLQKIHTKENLADVLTKPINTDKFVWSRSSCGLAET